MSTIVTKQFELISCLFSGNQKVKEAFNTKKSESCDIVHLTPLGTPIILQLFCWAPKASNSAQLSFDWG